MTQTAPSAFDLAVGTLIVGAGAAGLTAALAASERGDEVLVIEADVVPSGSTALSAGLVPAAATRFQREAGIEDSPDRFARDIQTKAKSENDPALVSAMTRAAGGVVEWLADVHGLPFSVVTDFDYPGHTRRRMHGLPSRSGRELIDALRNAAELRGVDIITGRRAETLHVDGTRVLGIAARAAHGVETIACQRLILACNGYGGNRALVARYMPQIEGALWFGHPGNRGEAITWADQHGFATDHLGAYQGHGNVAHPHGILISWAVIMEGGVQVNLAGRRFWDESQGYSEAARAVLAQQDGVAWSIFDSRIASVARQFEDFKQAEAQGAVKTAETVRDLADVTGLPNDALSATLAAIPRDGTDAFGRRFGPHPLAPPYCAVRVTGALFHTQGGLRIDPADARVLRLNGQRMDNLHAAGGAACGVSGSGDSGYLSGNGLLSALTLGWIAGTHSTGA